MIEKTVPCKYCDTPTRMLGTKLCDRCWEVSSRIGRIPLDVLMDILSKERIEQFTVKHS